MTDSCLSRSRSFALAALIALTAAMPLSLQAAPGAPGDPPGPITLTERDVVASNDKIAMAYGALSSMWKSTFSDLGERFVTPRLVRFRTPVRTICGIIRAGNAAYCAENNSIYFDEIFVAAQAKRAGQALGTDGDMAAVGVIAHEIGHAVATQIGHRPRFPYESESTADCLAGAFARHADEQGSLEAGDLDEAFHGMAAAGDPTPRLTGDARTDRRSSQRSALMGHGTRDQRMANFKSGYDNGAGACLASFHSA
jgi:uncharacterized protein